MTQIDQQEDDRLYLPFERRFEGRVLRDNRWFIALWMLVTSAICVLGMIHSVQYDYSLVVRSYLAPILVGNAAIWGNVLFILRTSELARKRLPAVISLLHTEALRSRSTELLVKRVYGPKWLLWISAPVAIFGEATFAVLGIQLPHVSTEIIFFIVAAAIFGLLGTTVGMAIGFWSWMHDFGAHHPRVDVFHPDKMGGLLPVSDVSDWVISMGAVLAALYSLGAYVSPYTHMDWKQYSYLWIVFASVMLALAFIVPAYSVHLCLVHARNAAAAKISRKNEEVFKSFEASSLSGPSDVMALMWFSESLGKLNVWPYRQLLARFVATVALQFLPLLLETFSSHFKK